MTGDPAPRSRRWDLWAPVLLTAAVALWFFPAPFHSQSVGLDGSYAWAINAFDDSGAQWGRDASFTFGPLGWLLLPHDQGNHLVQGLVFWIAAHLLFVAVFARRAFHRPERAAAFAALLLAAQLCGLGAGYRLLVLVILLLAPEPDDPRRRSAFPGAVVLAAALAVVLFLMRIHLGLAAFLALALHLLFERRWRPAAATALVICTGVISAFWQFFHGSPAAAWEWLRVQWELASGFSKAMSLPASDGTLAAGLVGLGVFALMALTNGGRNRRVWLLMTPAVLFAFKHGFVRADGHVRIFFAFLVIAAGLGMLSSRPGASTVLATIALLLALPVAPPQDHRTVLGLRGVSALTAPLDLPARQEALERQSRRALNKRKLPAPVVEDLRAAGSVDVVPWELTFLPANELPWRPQPVFQLYSAYTADLDLRTAEHFASDDAPERLLVHFDAIDRRHLLWDTPITWQTLLAHYRVDRRLPKKNLLVLRRRPKPVEGTTRALEAASIGTEWTDVPQRNSGETLLAEIDFEATVWGRISASIWRTPAVHLEFEQVNGHTVRHRLLPATAGGGLMVPPPKDLGSLADLFTGSVGPNVLRVRLAGPGLNHYRTPIAVRWQGITLR